MNMLHIKNAPKDRKIVALNIEEGVERITWWNGFDWVYRGFPWDEEECFGFEDNIPWEPDLWKEWA